MKKLIQSVLPKSMLGYVSSFMFRPFKSYSGEGEDAVSNRLFKGKTTGFYVDVGCFHPVVVSNTYHLYRRGWRGINIDVDQFKVDVFNRLRRRDKNICVAVSDQEGEAEFYFHSGETYGSMSGLDRSEAERRAKALGLSVLSRTVKTLPLSAILAAENVSKIDYLTVDVEGAEEAVLSTIDFDVVDIDVLAIEIHGDYDAVLGSGVYRLLSSKGYEIVAWTPPTVFFRQK